MAPARTNATTRSSERMHFRKPRLLPHHWYECRRASCRKCSSPCSARMQHKRGVILQELPFSSPPPDVSGGTCRTQGASHLPDTGSRSTVVPISGKPDRYTTQSTAQLIILRGVRAKVRALRLHDVHIESMKRPSRLAPESPLSCASAS